MKIGLLQLNSVIGDYEGNFRKLVEAYRQACERGAELVVAPELYLCGYPPRDLLLKESFVSQGIEQLVEVMAKVGEIPLLVGHVARNSARPGRALFNAASLLHNGRCLQEFHKCLLPTYDVFDEGRYFEPGDASGLFDWQGKKIGLTICEDIWNDEDFWPERLYRRDPVKELLSAGAQLIINLSASPWHRGKEKVRLAMLQRLAQDERVPVIQVNAVGANDELIFDGGSVAVDGEGRILGLGNFFEEQVMVVDLSEQAKAPDEISSEELLYRALVMGIRDYVLKTRFRSVALGLSGGIDSAVVAALAVAALGAENVLGVSMPSRYSSEGSKVDALSLAERLGIRCEIIPIEPSVEAMQRQLAGVFSGKAVDVTEENIQSRLRGVTLMAISNKLGSLILTTGNKSEMAVGYCTLYGDMCGAFAPICDLWKTEVYRLARWMNREQEIIPASSITKPPSAELRPDQTDQDSLPAYDQLDAILQALVVEEKSAEEIAAMGFNGALVSDIIQKVIFNEYKRRQASPGIRVSPRAFGMGRRLPIAQRFRG